MEMNIYRRKLLNAILFFAANTHFAGPTKISKLLCYLDFTHFKQTGHPSIGLKYYAFKNGPVPKSLWLEIKDGNLPEDFVEHLDLVKRTDLKYEGSKFIAKTTPVLNVFTPREIKILKHYAKKFKDTTASEISEISHQEKQPWHITYHTLGPNAPIDYMLAVDDGADVSKEDAAESLKSHFEIVTNFHIYPTTQQ